ncbi:nucleoside-diphosphate kinase [Ichthyobacterium seriolicida]|uniref:nucleoside-diphosphate kinase n=1 Tax=Ichthyobacterium seriolicida TaxID=242600 RepID=A0A1J1E5C1_9FLAO|nr:nucleoside-diphosphate kinase [Ichthyobacterium seriolicida]BAV94502.1 nucleoside diphosphate kinase [Ichthyobacterium seriolicida]
MNRGNTTLTMIKPDAVEAKKAGIILDKIIEAGFDIVALKMKRFTKSEAELFYQEHSERPFFPELVDFMISGPILAGVLKKENAVEEFRSFIGDTNPENAREGSIRKLYGKSISFNAIHGSDSDQSAKREIDLHFSDDEILNI